MMRLVELSDRNVKIIDMLGITLILYALMRNAYSWTDQGQCSYHTLTSAGERLLLNQVGIYKQMIYSSANGQDKT